MKSGPRTALTLLAVSVITLMCGCQEHSETAETTAAEATGPITVVTTTGMIADLARRLGGEHVEVVSLMGEGVDPHLYQPNRDDVIRMMDADLILYNGLMLEGNLDDALKASAPTTAVVAIAESIPENRLRYPEYADGHPDPHVWLDPALWALCSDPVAEQLAEMRPLQAESIRANQAAFVEECRTLSALCRDSIAGIPPERRLLITSHDAFQYFGEATGLEVRGIQGISTESEAGLTDIEGLVELIVTRRIPAVFIESSVPPRSIEALVEGARARGMDVRIGGELFGDSMGTPGTEEGTWPGMIRQNVATVTTALELNSATATNETTP